MITAVTGGTGFVGEAVVRHLLSEGHTPRLLVRPVTSSRPNPTCEASTHRPAGVESRQVTFEDASSLTAALAGADAAIHLVGIIAECGSSTFDWAHPGITARVVEAAKACGVRRFVHMSALGTRPTAASRYHQTKWASEGIVRGSGLDWTIFRPSLIYGHRDQFTRFFARMATYSPVLPAIGGGRALMQPISVELVGRAFARSVSMGEAIGRTYDLCGTERLAFREILATILAVQHRRRLILGVPFPLARLQAVLLEFLWPALLHRPPPLSRDQILMLREDNVGDGTPADQAFGLIHTPFRQALESFLS